MNENLEQILIFFEWHYRILENPVHLPYLS